MVFPALDARVKNVATAYTLEHQIESNLFDELSGMLALLGERDSLDADFHTQLAGCSEALSTVLAQHLAKEEEHVSPLDMEATARLRLHDRTDSPGSPLLSQTCCRRAWIEFFPAGASFCPLPVPPSGVVPCAC